MLRMMQSLRRKLPAFLTVLALTFLTAPQLQAQNEPQFTIAPPPLAYPDYTEPGTQQGKGTFTYINVSVQEFDLTGFGGSFTLRNVGEKDEKDLGSGTSFAGGLFLLTGSGDGLDVYGQVLSFMFNFEKEVMDEGNSNAIVFGGPNIGYTYLGATSEAFDVDIYITAIGFQAGVQYSVESESMIISPWFQYLNQFAGSVEACVYAYYSSCTEEDVDVSATTLGLDVLHVPSGVTLSGILQQSSGDADVTIIQVSFKFGEGSEAAEGDQKSAASWRTGGTPLMAQSQDNPPYFRN